MQPSPSELMLAPFDPDPNRMLDAMRKLVDDEMLDEIAHLDCGRLNAGPQRAALTELRDTGRCQAPMGWEPMEALELARWGEPESNSKRTADQVDREHRMRAFATAALLRALAEPENQDGRFVSSNDTLAVLVESVRALGSEYEADVASFVAWRVGRLGNDEERPFFAYALLVLAVLGSSWTVSDAWLLALCTWAIDEEFVERIALSFEESPEWLLGLTNFDQRHGNWRDLTAEVSRVARTMPEGPGRDLLTVITESIEPRVRWWRRVARAFRRSVGSMLTGKARRLNSVRE